jgi:hypothetical protein
MSNVTIQRSIKHFPKIERKNLSWCVFQAILNIDEINELLKVISNGLSDYCTISEVSILTHLVCIIFRIIKFKTKSKYISIC